MANWKKERKRKKLYALGLRPSSSNDWFVDRSGFAMDDYIFHR